MIDPATLATIIQGFGGAAQTGLGIIQRGRAEKEATNIIKGMKPDEGILDLYNQGLQRYGVSPRETSLYKSQIKNIQRSLATGANLLQKGGSKAILGGTSSLVGRAADASLAPEIAAEQQKERRFGALLPLTQMRAAEIRRPQEMNLQRLLQKAAGGTQLANTGMSNIFGAVQSAATRDLYRDIYGSGTNSEKALKGTDVTAAGLGQMDRIETPNLYGEPYQAFRAKLLQSGLQSGISAPRISSTPSSLRFTPQLLRRRNPLTPYLPAQQSYFPTYPF